MLCEKERKEFLLLNFLSEIPACQNAEAWVIRRISGPENGGKTGRKGKGLLSLCVTYSKPLTVIFSALQKRAEYNGSLYLNAGS